MIANSLIQITKYQKLKWSEDWKTKKAIKPKTNTMVVGQNFSIVITM